MTDMLLDAVVAAEADLAQAAGMLAIMQASAGIIPSDLTAGEVAAAEKWSACQAAYAAHAAAHPGEPLYEADQNGLIRLTPEQVQAHRDRWAQARTAEEVKARAEADAAAARQAEFDAAVAAAVEKALAARGA